jgi:Putative nucleotidyltransferase DUF294
MSAPAKPDAIAELATTYKRTWSNIETCAGTAAAERARINDSVKKLVPADCSFLVFGSLARDEATSGSDVDWSLLIDGAADPKHLDVAKELARLLKDKPPGPTNVFGCPVFSHDLVHLIGGEADTNSNTTRRILLLLESRSLLEHAGVRERVMRHLFRRYIEEDRGYHAVHDYTVRVPRFLLNDIVRFWRTMAVDYATKRRERGSDGWAIRNFKLRVSRKLVFVAGLAMCMSCHLLPSAALAKTSFESESDFTDALQDFLLDFANRTPLQVVSRFALDFGAGSVGAEILDAYDRFLGVLADNDKREQLKKLGVEDAFADNVFKEAREIGTDFQTGLTELFFDSDKNLTAAIQRYGVF